MRCAKLYLQLKRYDSCSWLIYCFVGTVQFQYFPHDPLLITWLSFGEHAGWKWARACHFCSLVCFNEFSFIITSCSYFPSLGVKSKWNILLHLSSSNPLCDFLESVYFDVNKEPSMIQRFRVIKEQSRFSWEYVNRTDVMKTYKY